MYFKFFQLCFGHLFPAVRGQVEDKNSEEGDAHAGDDQVHLVVVVMITKEKVIMITKEDMVDDYDHQGDGDYDHQCKDDDDHQGEGHESYWSVCDNDQ